MGSTVGDLATEVVRAYIGEAGYQNFSEYWEHHKNRSYSLSWFALRLRRERSRDPRNPDRFKMEALRNEVARLPAPDRQWTVLWLGTLPNPNNPPSLYSTDELLASAGELGHDTVIELLGGRIRSSDPDLRPRQDPVYAESLEVLQTFVLKHSPQLLAKTDRDFLLQEKFHRSVWYAIGAAQVNPGNAAKILHASFQRFDGKTDDYSRAVLAMALWDLLGDSETRFIADWFYGASMGYGLYATPRHMFLEDADTRAGARPLIAALIRDPRFDKLDWNSLDDLVWMIRRWIGRDFVAPDLEVRGRSEDARIRDAALAEYRRRIRATVHLWLGGG